MDSEAGEPYKGTTVSSVLRSSLAVPVVDQFRKAVKVEYADSRLKGVAPSDLLVYKNKAAFNKRKADVKEGKEEPLEEDSLVEGLGTSKKEALIVAVPIPSTQPSSFRPCEEPFFNSIGEATECDGWIKFGHTIPSTTLQNLYIRDSYRTIASSINPGINKVIITGTPGIGKSLFLIYLLWILAKGGKRVLFIYHPYNIYYDGKGGVFRFASGHLPLDDDKSFWNDTLWCLFDTKLQNESHLQQIPIEVCTFIVSTSPRRELMSELRKPPDPEMFYMPTWTEAEMEAIAPFFPDTNEWRERFRVLGGVPRHVLESTKQHPTEMLKAACGDRSLDDCIGKVGMNSTITERSKISHLLVHITSTPPYRNSSVCFASQTALNIIVQEKWQVARVEMRNLLASCQGNHLAAALCGYIFEPYAIEMLEKGGTFKCRELVHGNRASIPEKTELVIPQSTKEVADKVEGNQAPNQLYVPKTTNYTAIDAWIPGIGAFQMTVGKNHAIKAGAERDLDMLGKRLYWLLPPLYYDSFTKKSPTNIKQFAVLIPYPEY